MQVYLSYFLDMKMEKLSRPIELTWFSFFLFNHSDGSHSTKKI